METFLYLCSEFENYGTNKSKIFGAVFGRG